MKLEKIKKIQNRKTKNVGQLGVKSSSSCGHKIIQSYCDNSQDINHNFWRRGRALGLGLRSPKGRFWRKMKLSKCRTISMSDEINKSHR